MDNSIGFERVGKYGSTEELLVYLGESRIGIGSFEGKNYARNSWYQGRIDISVTFLSSITGHGSAQLALNGVNNNVDTDDLHSFHLIMRVNVKR